MKLVSKPHILKKKKQKKKLLQNSANEGILAYENIIINKVIAKIGLVLAKTLKSAIYLKQFWRDAKTMENILMVINT